MHSMHRACWKLRAPGSSALAEKPPNHPAPTTPPQPPQLTPHPNHPTPTTPANTPIVRITTQQNPGAQKSRR